MYTSATTTFTRGSLRELKRLTTLICYACLNPAIQQKHTNLTVYYDFVGSCGVKFINISPKIEYRDNFSKLLNIAVAQNTPSKFISICIEYHPSFHEILAAREKLIDDKNFGIYAKTIL